MKSKNNDEKEQFVQKHSLMISSQQKDKFQNKIPVGQKKNSHSI
jgi:hypothetical protein